MLIVRDRAVEDGLSYNLLHKEMCIFYGWINLEYSVFYVH